MAQSKILIVDDEMILRESLVSWLSRDNHHVEAVAGGEEALRKLEKESFDLVFLDIKLEGMSGMEVLERLKDLDPDVAVIMITAYGSIASAVEAMKLGARDYLLKPFEPDTLSLIIERNLKEKARVKENLYLRQQQKEYTRFESLVGQSRAMQDVFGLIRDVAPVESTVLISGETGTGKELAAKAIHTHSTRCQGPFVAVNCGAVPEHLMESELFGHQKGAFTDAKETRKGRLELACGGTLFLDEIGEISTRMQIDLLRVLEERTFYRVGGTQPLKADFRVIAATNKDLWEAVRQKTFREDLFYRLKVFSLEMPPLRQRKEDIPLLVDHFRQRFAQEINKSIDGFTREALDEMMLYEWPGNVRELQNAVERAIVVGKERFIQPWDLPIYSDAAGGARDESLQEMEKQHIARILEETAWNISQSAKRLGIDRSTLYKKINRYALREMS
jgi:DNA-binding NtrC family response regulator